MTVPIVTQAAPSAIELDEAFTQSPLAQRASAEEAAPEGGEGLALLLAQFLALPLPMAMAISRPPPVPLGPRALAPTGPPAEAPCAMALPTTGRLTMAEQQRGGLAPAPMLNAAVWRGVAPRPTAALTDVPPTLSAPMPALMPAAVSPVSPVPPVTGTRVPTPISMAGERAEPPAFPSLETRLAIDAPLPATLSMPASPPVPGPRPAASTTSIPLPPSLASPVMDGPIPAAYLQVPFDNGRLAGLISIDKAPTGSPQTAMLQLEANTLELNNHLRSHVERLDHSAWQLRREQGSGGRSRWPSNDDDSSAQSLPGRLIRHNHKSPPT